MGTTNFPNGLTSFGIPVLGAGSIPFTGKYFFVDPANGNDGNQGTSASRAFATLYQAYAKCRSGMNDVVYLIGNGASSGTARLSLALAQTIDSTATTGKLTWAKNACHLIGVTAPSANPRARIAPPTGTYTAATFNSANFVEVSGTGCVFANLAIFNGFSTGGAAQICWKDSGGRNYYENVSFGGMGDAASAADADSRSLVISGSGENSFKGCIIGLDTVARSAANSSLEFAGATARNKFSDCLFPFFGSAATPLGILATGDGAMDRWQSFDNCQFINAIKSTSTAMSVLASCTTASAGGLLLFKNCTKVGITKFGDTNGLAVSYVDGAAPTAATSGMAVNPT